MSLPDLRVQIGPIELKNPVLTASGTFGYGQEFSSLVDPGLLGGIVVKGLSLKPRAGIPPQGRGNPLRDAECHRLGQYRPGGIFNRKAALAQKAKYGSDC